MTIKQVLKNPRNWIYAANYAAYGLSDKLEFSNLDSAYLLVPSAMDFVGMCWPRFKGSRLMRVLKAGAFGVLTAATVKSISDLNGDAGSIVDFVDAVKYGSIALSTGIETFKNYWSQHNFVSDVRGLNHPLNN
jgi:hypothetical protein